MPDELRTSKDRLAHELYGAIKYTPGKIISIHRELANRILTALRAENEPPVRQCNHGAISPKGTLFYHGFVGAANHWRCDVCKGVYEGNLTEPTKQGSQLLTLVSSPQPAAGLRDVAAQIIQTCRAVDSHANDVLVSRELMGKLVHAWEHPCSAQPPELPRVTPEPQPSSEDVRDAERYRLLRGGNDYQRGGPMVVLCEQNHIDSDDRPFWSLAGEALDSEVDRLGITKGDGQ